MKRHKMGIWCSVELNNAFWERALTTTVRICRNDGCDQLCTMHSVFCEEHHTEQLQRIGIKRRTLGDQLRRFWNLHRRGLLSGREAMLAFLDEVSPDSIAAEFAALPADFQSLIAEFLNCNPPETLPRCYFIGPASKEGIDAATAVRRANAKVLLEHLTSRSK